MKRQEMTDFEALQVAGGTVYLDGKALDTTMCIGELDEGILEILADRYVSRYEKMLGWSVGHFCQQLGESTLQDCIDTWESGKNG